MFAVGLVPLSVGAAVAIDYSRLAAGRAVLQRIADNAALSGAAAYVAYTTNDAYRTVAQTVARSTFCSAAQALPSGMTTMAVSGGVMCGTANGPSIAAAIGGWRPGTPGVDPAAGCTSTTTVVAGARCGFVVTVAASGTFAGLFPALLSGTRTLSVTATAANPFLNVASALKPSLKGSATYANSLWVYPLLLNDNGQPDFSANSGALPSLAACTGAPTQTSCGSYTMLASTKYASCTTAAPCTVNGAVFGGTGGIVQNPAAGAAVITATTPLGIAFVSSAGGVSSYGYNSSTPGNGCQWPLTLVYNTVTQLYDAAGNPLLVDSSGRWTLPTHWFFSSFLANGLPPSQNILAMQSNTAIDSSTGLAFNVQDIPSVPAVTNGVNSPTVCPQVTAASNRERLVTTFPSSGATNCSLYIVKDPTSHTPDPALKVAYGQAGNCFTPAGTPGAQYAAISCAGYGNHTFAFFWNDMGGRIFDDTDYGNGNLQVGCTGATNVLLIN